MRIALLLLLPGLPAAALTRAQVEVPHFVERPGSLEFSGQLIVRPAQPATLAERGLSAVGAETLRARAAQRLRPHLVEYVPETDEHIVSLPSGQDEGLASVVLDVEQAQFLARVRTALWIAALAATVVALIIGGASSSRNSVACRWVIPTVVVGGCHSVASSS